MAQEDLQPWSGKKCSNCDAPINYAYTGHVIGWCGKCTDQLRNLFKDDLRREMERDLAAASGAASTRGGGGLPVGLVLGLVLGFGGALGTAVFAPETWHELEGALAAATKKK